MNNSCKIYDFLSKRHLVFKLSVFLFFIASCIIIIRGFNWGLEFTGGMVVELSLEKNVNVKNVKDILTKEGFKNITIQNFKNTSDIIIKLPFLQNENDFSKKTEVDFLNIFKKNISQSFSVKQMNWLGPNINNNLIEKSIISIFIALISMLVYIGLRFEWRLAIGAVVSLMYDLVIILSILSLVSIELDFIVIASLMSVIGYSLNDKIVIFDRIRENFFKSSSILSSYKVFNVSLTQVLNRTIITSITTVFVLLILLIFGGSILFGFSITLLIGVVIGTISSIYIASIIAYKLGVEKKHFLKNY